jgi:hypothetical protein
VVWKLGQEHLFDIGLKGITVDGTIEQPGCDDAACREMY